MVEGFTHTDSFDEHPVSALTGLFHKFLHIFREKSDIVFKKKKKKKRIFSLAQS